MLIQSSIRISVQSKVVFQSTMNFMVAHLSYQTYIIIELGTYNFNFHFSIIVAFTHTYDQRPFSFYHQNIIQGPFLRDVNFMDLPYLRTILFFFTLLYLLLLVIVASNFFLSLLLYHFLLVSFSTWLFFYIKSSFLSFLLLGLCCLRLLVLLHIFKSRSLHYASLSTCFA